MTCPRWCAGEHDDGERRHTAGLCDVPVTADAANGRTPTLFLELRQGPGDDEPLIHFDRDEDKVARLRRNEALTLVRRLIDLLELSR